MVGINTAIATVLAALFTSATVARAEILENLEGDARVLASPAALNEPGASVAHFLWMSAGPRRDVRDAPGALLLFTDGGYLIAMAGDDARRFAPWRRDPDSGRPLHPDAPDGARCATGVESTCWRPGDRVPYSNDVAVALGAAPPYPLVGPIRDPRFDLICAASVGFSSADHSACTPIPLVPLNSDPPSATPPRSTPFFGTDVLTDREEALLGCGPFWGTDCSTDGIDLRNIESSVLVQSMLGLEGTYSPSYDPQNFTGWRYGSGLPQPGTVAFVGTPVPCNRVTQLSSPCTDLTNPFDGGGFGNGAGQVFQSEMAALSFNMQNLLVAFSVPSAAAGASGSVGQTELDASNPFSRAPNQCSFAQPQYCANNRAFFSYAVPASDGRLQWLWEDGAEYRVVDAYGDVGAYLGGRVDVLGLEKSRTREASLGVPIALFPAAGATLAPDTRFAMPNPGDSGKPSFGFAYLSLPEPSGSALAIAALSALAAISRRRARQEADSRVGRRAASRRRAKFSS